MAHCAEPFSRGPWSAQRLIRPQRFTRLAAGDPTNSQAFAFPFTAKVASYASSLLDLSQQVLLLVVVALSLFFCVCACVCV